MSITWEPVRNTGSRAPPQSYQIRICLLPRFPGDLYACFVLRSSGLRNLPEILFAAMELTISYSKAVSIYFLLPVSTQISLQCSRANYLFWTSSQTVGLVVICISLFQVVKCVYSPAYASQRYPFSCKLSCPPHSHSCSVTTFINYC